MTSDPLAQALLQAVRAQHFEATADAQRGGAALTHFPSLDLALIAFPANAAPVWANVLFSREHPQGLVAGIVRGLAPRSRHYIAAVITNLGTRYAACEPCATTWRLPALGAAVDAAVAPWLEARA